MKQKILCVDDESNNVDALKRIFRKDYEVFTALSGEEAILLVKSHPDLSLIISDQRMPGMQGVEFLKSSMEFCPEAIRILLTGYTDIESIIDSINKGEVYRYINKPWDPVDLKNTVDKAIEKFQLRQELNSKNQELKAALDELRGLDEAKNSFMILINHELKTPLTVLKSFSDLLKETSLNEEQALFLGKISKSTDKLQFIINSVLEFVKAETGAITIHKKNVDLSKIIENTIKKSQINIDSKKLTLKTSLPSVKYKVDPEIFEKVITEFIENAIEFSPEKETVELTLSSKENSIVTLKNQSKPISQKQIDNILKPFTLDENVLNHSKGLGMGIAKARAYLKCMDMQLNISYQKPHFIVRISVI